MFFPYVLLILFYIINLSLSEVFPNFVLGEYSNEGEYVEHSVTSLNQCSQLCKQYVWCIGFELVSQSYRSLHCLMYNSNNSTMKHDLIIMEKGSKINLTEKCDKRSFAFSKLKGRKIKEENEFILSTMTVFDPNECFNYCILHSECLSVQLKRTSMICQLMKISINSVYDPRKYFIFDDEYDLYENNCHRVEMSDSSCSYMIMKSVGENIPFDQLISSITSVQQCQSKCIERERFTDPCRSYTFDSSTSNCYLSHLSSRLSYSSSLIYNNINHNLTHGDIDDCSKFDIKCHPNKLELRGRYNKMFSGMIRTKEGKRVLCELNITSQYQFSSFLQYDKCGIIRKENPSLSYNGYIHVKESSTPLITIRDKVLKVHCQLHESYQMDQTVSAKINIRPGNDSNKMISDSLHYKKKEMAPYLIRVLTDEGKETNIVEMKKTAWITINTINGKRINEISIRNLMARDVTTGRKRNIIDENGCVINNQITKIWKYSENEIRLRIHFESFRDNEKIVFQVLIESCSFQCYPQCLQHLWKYDNISNENIIREKREIYGRQLNIIHDIYQINGGRITILDDFIPYSSDVQTEKAFSSISSCIFHDIPCLFTLLFILIQFILIFICVLIVFCFIRNWRLYSSSEISNEC